MGKLVSLLKTWGFFCFKGLRILPDYFSYWGIRRALRRLIKSSILPGLNQTTAELTNFRRFKENKIPLKRRPDYIVVGPDYIGNSAGIGCLYQLAYDLSNLGFETAVTGSQVGHPGYPTPLISKSEARAAAKAGTWVIYPETVSGNPLRAKNVIRWVLNRPGLLGGASVYPESEHIFVYSDVYSAYVKNKIQGKLYMPTLDRSIFFPPDKDEPRSISCYYVGKSKFKEGHLDPKTTLEITRSTPPKSELGKIFRASKVLYCFDNSTALTYEAIVCGCKVVIIPDGTQTKEDYERLELGTAGMSWSDHKFEGDSSTLEAKLRANEEQYRAQLQDLATYTQRISPTLEAPTQLIGAMETSRI